MKAAERYEVDFVLWTEEQAQALRELARSETNLPLDLENLAEEIESLGRSQRTDLSRRIGAIIEHLLKLECLPRVDSRRERIDTVFRERSNIELLLEASPSLKLALAEIVAAEHRRTTRLVIRLLTLHEQATEDMLAMIKATTYDAEQVLGPWLPANAVSGPTV